jgi:hypothetical protein
MRGDRGDLVRKRSSQTSRRARCEVCGRFYSTELPDDSVCNDHVFDWNRKQRLLAASTASTSRATEDAS